MEDECQPVCFCLPLVFRPLLAMAAGGGRPVVVVAVGGKQHDVKKKIQAAQRQSEGVRPGKQREGAGDEVHN